MSKDIYNLVEKWSSQSIDYRPSIEECVENYFQNKPQTLKDFYDEEYTSWGAPKGELNIFYGGEIQRRAHAEGKHKHYKSEAGKKSWKNRDKKTATDKMVAGYKKILSTPEGALAHKERSKKGAEAARLVCSKKITYNGKVYLGWKNFTAQTNISKYKFIKDNLGIVE